MGARSCTLFTLKTMKQILLLSLILFSLTVKSQRIEYHNQFPSHCVAPRNVEVWLPREYAENPERRFPVLYMHDGQNVFNPKTSYAGIAWRADSTAAVEIAAGRVQPMIIVAVWNSPKRFQEYCPAKPVMQAEPEVQEYLNAMRKDFQKDLLADEYLRFLVTELKPFIDSAYRTKTTAESTAICGSSMGGLISMYAICEYPDVFGSAACVSTHWPLGYNNDNPAISKVLKDYVQKSLPSPVNHRLYFDYGTQTLDSLYEVHQDKINEIMVEKGYVYGKNWQTCKFQGAEHSEPSWRDRFDVILGFLYGIM